MKTTLRGSIGPDVLTGTMKPDEIWGEAGDDRLFGGAGNDVLYGGAGDDALFGGADNDRLHGGFGDDVLIGGTGNDAFIFDRNGSHDIVADYTDGEDRLDFSDFHFATRAGLLSHAAQSDANVVFSFATGETVTLHNVDLSTLGGADFVI